MIVDENDFFFTKFKGHPTAGPVKLCARHWRARQTHLAKKK